MLDRGLRRRFDPAVERAAREAAEPRRRSTSPRRDLRDLPTFTIDPATARDFDDAISAERLGDGAMARLGPHRRRRRPTCGRARSSTARPTGARRASTSPARSSRCCRRRCPTTPARSCPAQDRLAVTVELEIDGRRGERSAFYRSLIRSDERLDYDAVDRIFAGARARRGAVGGAAGRRARGRRPRSQAARDGARRARGRVRRAGVRFDGDGHVDAVAPERADRVAPADRAPDDRRQRGGRAAARRAQRARALPRPRAARAGARSQRLVEQLASLDVPTPPLPRARCRRSRRPSSSARSRAGRRARRAAPATAARRSPRSCCARSSRRTTRRENLGHAGLRSHALLPLHLADPPLPRPRLPPRAAVARSAAGEDAPRGGAARGGRRRGTSTRERDAMPIERAADDVARCFLLEARAVRARLADRSSTARSSA